MTAVYQVVGYYVTIGSVQVVGFLDVAAPLCADDGPIAALVGGSSCRTGSVITTPRTFNDYKTNITVYTFNEHGRRKIQRRCPITFMKAGKMLLASLQHKIL